MYPHPAKIDSLRYRVNENVTILAFYVIMQNRMIIRSYFLVGRIHSRR